VSSFLGFQLFQCSKSEGLIHYSGTDGGVGDVKNNVLLLEHVNINHVKGRHDLLSAFYFKVLGCAVDRRRAGNLALGAKTVWANIGITQFHLPESDSPQIIPGKIVLSYPDLSFIKEKLQSPPPILEGSKFNWHEKSCGTLAISCPWGNSIEIVHDEGLGKDSRGKQDSEDSVGSSIKEIQIYVEENTNLEGIMRFYKELMGAKIRSIDENILIIEMGPFQTLCFQRQSKNFSFPVYDGHHIAIYVYDLPATFQRMEQHGLIFVNKRFEDKADSLEKALEYKQFRTLHIVDPLNPAEVIIQLEHEIRSTDLPACPFNDTFGKEQN